MSAETATSEPAPTNECGDGLVRDPETGECIPKADVEVTTDNSAATAAEKGLFPSVRAVIQEALDKTVKEMEQKMTTMMTDQLTKIQKEFATGLRKELGLKTDPTVTKTELNGAIRKAMLDLKLGDGKKTPKTIDPLNKGVNPKTPEHPGDQFKNYGAAN